MTKSITLSKLAAVLVAVSMVAGLAFAFAAQRAHALTLSELVELFIALEVIPADKADEARSVLSSEDTAAPAAAMSCNFTRNLTIGDTGSDVMDLQKLLNSSGFTVNVGSAAGAPGHETSYYGPATAAAVTAMQSAFASEILTPLGLTSGTGFFGASTRAKANTLCASSDMGDDDDDVPPPPPALGDDDDDDMGDDDDDIELGDTEASLEDFDELSSPSSEDLREGEEDAGVFGFEFDVEDGDISVRRVDVNFQSQTTAKEDEPWEALESVSLWRDGEKIAEENADDEDDWSDEGSDIYQIRFSGLDERFEDGDTAEFIVGVTVSNGIDDSDLTQTWKVWVPTNGLRAIDGAGIDQYTGSNTDFEEFDIESASADTDVDIRTASSNPEASTIKVDDSADTDDVTVLVMEVDVEENDVEFNRVVVFATTSDDKMLDVVSEVYLEVDGEQYEYDYFGAATTSTSNDGVQGGYFIWNLDSNDDEFTLDGDTEEEFKIVVDLQDTNNGARYALGTTIEFDVDTNARTGWEVDDISGDELGVLGSNVLGGSAQGEAHQLLSEGIFAEIVSTDADITTTNNGTEDIAEFEIKFDVTAFEDTFFVSATTSLAVVYKIEKNNSTFTESGATGTSTAVLSSTASQEGETKAFRIDSGDTETFTLSVNLDVEPGQEDFYRLVLVSVDYGTGSDTVAGPTNQAAHVVSPEEDFETDNVKINQAINN